VFRTWFSPEVRTLFEMLLARLPRSLAPFGESLLGGSQAVTGAK